MFKLNSVILITNLILLIQAQYVYDLYANTAAGIASQSTSYTQSSPTSTLSCSGMYVLQGPSTGTISKTFSTPTTHSYLSVFFSFYVIGDWSVNDYITVSGNKFPGPISPATSNLSCIGISSKVGIAEGILQISHTLTTFTFTIDSLLSVGRGYAIRDLVISSLSANILKACFKIEPSLTSTSSKLCQAILMTDSNVAHTNTINVLLCPANCYSCNSKGCMRCYPGYFLTALSCSACLPNCYFCTNGTICLACNTGFLLNSNNACTSTCSLLTKSNIIYNSDCYTPCTNSFSLLNQQCYASCPQGFASSTLNNALVCQKICNSTAYYYQGACYSQCLLPLYPRIDNVTLLQYCYTISCPVGYAALPDGNCIIICPAGTVLNTSDPNLSTCQGPCPIFEYYQNGSCVSQCTAPFFSFTDPDSHILLCILCNNTDGYLPDQTCAASCPSNTTNTTIYKVTYCLGPCPLSEYFFNNTCLPLCLPPYHDWIDPQTHIPQCLICEGINNYTLPDFTCAYPCPVGLTPMLKDGLEYCIGTCYDITQYLYKNGTCMSSCSMPFTPYLDSITHELKCKLCDGTDGLLPNFSCTPVCPSSTVNVSYYNDFYCEPLCPAPKYLYKNLSCLNNCSLPFSSILDADGFNTLCYTCNGTDSVLPNGTCVANCTNNTVFGVIDLNNFCLPICPAGQFYYSNSTCLPTCPYYTIWDSDGFNLLCKLCSGTYGFLPNGTCSSICPNRTINISVQFDVFCELACQNSGLYLYNNGSCLPSCSAPLKSYYDSLGNLMCSFCADNEVLLPNNTCASQCPQNYIAILTGDLNICTCRNPNFLYKDGTCLTSCLQDFTINTTIDLLTNYCDLCPIGQFSLPDKTCSSNGCLNGSNFTSKYGEKLCNSILCLNGAYNFNYSCYTSCPLGTSPYTDTINHVFSCFVPIAVLGVTQINNTCFTIQFNNTLLYSSLPPATLILSFIDTTTQPDYTIVQTADSQWMVVISNMEAVSASQLQISFTGSLDFTSSGIGLLFIQNFTAPISRVISIQNPVPAAVIDSFQMFTSSSMGVAAGSALAVSSSIGFKVQISMVQYLMALLFLNINYPRNLLQFLQIFKVARMKFIPNPFQDLADNLEKKLITSPDKFFFNQFSTFLLDNIGNLIFVSILFSSVHLIGYVLMKTVKHEKTRKIIPKVLAKIGLPGLASFLIGFSVILTVSSILQLRFPEKSGILVFSWIVALVIMIAQIYFIRKIYLLKNEIITHPEKKTEILAFYDIIISGLKFDKLGIPSPYLATVLLRDIIQFTMIVIFYDIPILQIISQMLSTFTLSMIVLIQQPYISKIQNFLDLSREILLTVIFILALVIKVQDDNQSEIGLGIVGLCCGIVATQFLGGIGLVLINFYQGFKERKNKFAIGKYNQRQFKRINRYKTKK